MRYVIIGGSIAGVSAAKAIRGNDANAEIRMLSVEKSQLYYRPLISSVIEQKGIDISVGGRPMEEYGIDIIYDQAIGIDVSVKEVMLSSKKRIPYDKLLIATGRRPVIPAVPGVAGPDIFPFRNMEDARNILAVAQGRKNAVVLGGGFVGLKAAIALKRLGLRVTIIELLDRILHDKLDTQGSSIISDLVRRADIDIVTHQRYYEIIRVSGAVRSVRLASGRIVDADVIVAATGTTPNIEAFKDSGIDIHNGIVIQDTLQTSVADIYAAGDVVEYRDIVSNRYSTSASWANAEEMGTLAGKNMSGAPVKYSGFLSLMHSVEILATPVTTIGMIDPLTSDYDVFVERSSRPYRKLVFKNDVLVGALFIGSTARAGVYPYLIKNRIPLGKLKELAIRGVLGAQNFKDPVTPAI